MLKLALIVPIGLAAAALTLGTPPLQALPGACDVSSRAEAIQWGHAHPGQSYVTACQAAGGS